MSDVYSNEVAKLMPFVAVLRTGGSKSCPPTDTNL